MGPRSIFLYPKLKIVFSNLLIIRYIKSMNVKMIINSIAQPFMAGNKVESIHKQGVYALTTHYGNAVNGVYISTEFVFPAINGWVIKVRNVSKL